MTNKFIISLGLSTAMVSIMPSVVVIVFMATFLQTSSLYPHQFVDSLLVTWKDIQRQHNGTEEKPQDTITNPNTSTLPKPFHDTMVHVFRFGHSKGLW